MARKRFIPKDMAELTSKAAAMLGDEFELPDSATIDAFFAARKKDAEALSAEVQGSKKASDIQIRIYQNMVGSQLAILPVAFDEYRKTKSEGKAYAIASISNGLKENLAILASLENQDVKADRIMQSIIMPAMLSIASHAVTASGGIKAAVDTAKLKPKVADTLKAAVDTMLKQHAVYLQGQIDALQERIYIEITGEDPGQAATTAAKEAKKKAKPVSDRPESPRTTSKKSASAGVKKKAPKKKAGGRKRKEDAAPWEDD